jgi:hypothetical protein
MQRFLSWIGGSALLLTAACGNTRTEVESDSGSTPEDDATPGAGGSPNDARTPDRDPPGLPPQTSLFFVIGPPRVGGPGCAIAGNYIANIGGPPKSSVADPGAREVDGVGDARVGCRVSGGPDFDISGSAEKGATAFVLLGGSVSAGAGTATIGVAGPGTAGRQLISPERGCQVNAMRAPFQVLPGNIWAEFDCPAVSSASDPGSMCSARGEFVFENCER